MPAPIVVHEPAPAGGRLITLDECDSASVLGIARDWTELIAILSAAGYEFTRRDLRNPALVEWRGGDQEVWS
ncbi:Nif11-like leader peptide family natural product precursor [Streptomyces albidus (ex Kaewkla and Franco 2022)]|uniref:Nif11-like leader peptide family natural product precursor n=1 Tax=Streptomyces albidus (ex Kaewkla and Franco 2022) TaxID=722709 RepID=UPI0015EF6A63|nr:Nif11-like leader peptide family natural product precursor [Streptomyces albidus (ex Kaewkla and Franco 2022)]